MSPKFNFKQGGVIAVVVLLLVLAAPLLISAKNHIIDILPIGCDTQVPVRH